MRKKYLLITLAVLGLFVTALLFLYSLNLLPGKISNAISYSKCKFLYSLGLANAKQKYMNTNPSEIFHVRSIKPDTPLAKIIKDQSIRSYKDFNIFIDLSSRTLYLKNAGNTLKEYRIAAGSKTSGGDKEKRDDYRTPKGEFYICSKELYSPPKGYLGSRWMLLSYPNAEDAERGLKNQLISQDVFTEIKEAIGKKSTPPQNTRLGSSIGIHGGARPGLPKDWTAGCIGMYDQDVEEIYEYIKTGTRVIIN